MTEPKTRLLFLRHGETAWNLDGRYQGHEDSALTAEGEAQADAAGRWLDEHEPMIDVAYSSDLGRAVETARRVMARRGLAVGLDARLRERHMGRLQGRRLDDPDPVLAASRAAYRSGDLDARPEGGESMREVTARVEAFVEEIARRHAGQTALVVTHGGWLALLLRHALSLPPEAERRFVVLNASLQELRHDGERLWLWSWGQTLHLR